MINKTFCAEGANFLKNCPVKVKISSGKGFKKFGPQDFGGGHVPPVAPPPPPPPPPGLRHFKKAGAAPGGGGGGAHEARAPPPQILGAKYFKAFS